jgi:hypothetical protein
MDIKACSDTGNKNNKCAHHNIHDNDGIEDMRGYRPENGHR